MEKKECPIYSEAKSIARAAIKSAFDNDLANDVKFLLGFNEGQKWRQKQSYTTSDVNTIIEKFRERCIVTSSDFLSEGNIREIDYSDLLNK